MMKPVTNSSSKKGALPFHGLRDLLGYLDTLGQPADLRTLARLLGSLRITRADLEPVCVFKDEKYQRNLVRQTDWYELVCLCWTSGQRTPIHDHAGSSCAFLVVEGVATETRFEHTPSGLICPIWTKRHEPGYVCASAEADVHQVCNTQPPGKDLITLHCYSPQLRNFNVYSLDSLTVEDAKNVQTHRREVWGE